MSLFCFLKGLLMFFPHWGKDECVAQTPCVPHWFTHGHIPLCGAQGSPRAAVEFPMGRLAPFPVARKSSAGCSVSFAALWHVPSTQPSRIERTGLLSSDCGLCVFGKWYWVSFYGCFVMNSFKFSKI